MTKNNWRKDVDASIKDYLEAIIEEVHKHKDSYKNAKNPPAAQLWCALASLSKQVFDLNLKIKLLEKALKDNMEKPSHIKEVPSKDERKDLMSIAANSKKQAKVL